MARKWDCGQEDGGKPGNGYQDCRQETGARNCSQEPGLSPILEWEMKGTEERKVLAESHSSNVNEGERK